MREALHNLCSDLDDDMALSSHVLVSAGWRTLTMDRAQVSLAMQGPRAAVQLVF
jgi:hypothetical protein